MNKSKFFRSLGVSAISTCLLTGSLLGFTGCSPATPQKSNQEDTEKQPAVVETIDYETPYLEYIESQYEYFNRGILLCDLNDDNVPELFSIAYDTEGDKLMYHQLQEDGTVIAKEDIATYIDSMQFVDPSTFFETPRLFFGIYKNKTTAQKALINSNIGYENRDVFDVITFEGDSVVLKSEGVTDLSTVDKKRDEIMSCYEVSEKTYELSYLLRGEFGGEHGNNPVAGMQEAIEQFKEKQTPEYASAVDGELECYIKSINLSDNEMILVPVAYVTYEAYTNAKEGEKFITINEDEMSLQYDENLAEEQGIAHLFQMPWMDYAFEIPTEEYPESVLQDYFCNTPMKVKISKDCKIRYGVTGIYDENGNPTGYETLGRKPEYTVSEYLPHYAEYSMGSYYKATIKNNELVSIDVMYRP